MPIRSASYALLVLSLAGLCAAQAPLFGANGAHVGDALGTALANAGDVDGDGVDDLVVGAPGAPGGQGYARVHSGATGAQLLRVLDPGGPDLFGAAVCAAGDLDGDGRGDIAIGAPGSAAVPGGGRVRIVSGATGAILFDLAATGDDGNAFGAALAALPDLSGGGKPELLVGAPATHGGGTGAAFVVRGEDGGVLHALHAPAPGSRFGASLARAGRVDGDGLDDLIVGAPAGNFARVYSGADGGLILHLPAPAGDFGRAVCGAGDVNGDGVDDLAVGAPLFNQVDVLSGANGALLRRFDALSGAFGAALAPLGDVSGDGVPDLLVGAPQTGVSGLTQAGALFGISGASGQTLLKLVGAVVDERLGAAVAALGDLDGDGEPEVAGGAPGAMNGRNAAGDARAWPSDLLGAIAPYGFGCPGSFLITPTLELLGEPRPDGEVALTIAKGFGGGPAIVFFGAGQGVTPAFNGCILWVAPVLPFHVALTLTGAFPGSGTASLVDRLPLGIPPGTVITMQAFIGDPGADGGFSTTGATQLTVL